MKTELVKEEEEKKKKTQNKPNQWKKKKEKKKNRTANLGKERKKKSKGAAKYCLWVPYVCLITILSLNYELWKLKTTKMYF